MPEQHVKQLFDAVEPQYYDRVGGGKNHFIAQDVQAAGKWAKPCAGKAGEEEAGALLNWRSRRPSGCLGMEGTRRVGRSAESPGLFEAPLPALREALVVLELLGIVLEDRPRFHVFRRITAWYGRAL